MALFALGVLGLREHFGKDATKSFLDLDEEEMYVDIDISKVLKQYAAIYNTAAGLRHLPLPGARLRPCGGVEPAPRYRFAPSAFVTIQTMKFREHPYH